MGVKRGGYRAAARTLLRESLLDSAGELMHDAPWSEISMAAWRERVVPSA